LSKAYDTPANFSTDYRQERWSRARGLPTLQQVTGDIEAIIKDVFSTPTAQPGGVRGLK
jgi:hypothetical protein